MSTVKLRQLTTAKGLTPAELELLQYNNWIIENALNSVGAVSPVATSVPSPPTIPIRHDQLLELGDDDHLQYLLLAGRGAGGQDIINPVRIDGQTVVKTNDARLSDARTPTAHTTSHQSGGSDVIKLDDLSAPDDNTDLNASITKHGLMQKYPNDATKFLRGDGTFQTVAAEAFPIGAVFIGVVSTNPNTLLGYGTWSAFGAGRVLVGLNSGDTDFDTVEETGGAKTVVSTGTIDAPDVATVCAVGATSVASGTHIHNYTGNATSVVQPYIVVYMWKRTA